MARLLAVFASSHSVMLTCELVDWQRNFRVFDPKGTYFTDSGEECSYQEVLKLAPANAAELVTDAAIEARFNAVHAAMAALRQKIAAAKLDALVICGDDQRELFRETLMPSIGIYHGKTIRNGARKDLPAGEWYKKAQSYRLEPNGVREYPVEHELATHFIEGLVERDFDIAALNGFEGDQYEGHAFSFIHRTYLGENAIPVVPIFLNTFFPPNQPTPKRCLALGAAVRALIDSYPRDLRVGLIASGGLSHFRAEATLDQSVINAIRRKDTDFLARLDPKRLQAGSSEIRNWIMLAGAAPDFDLDWISYTPGYRTEALTGTGLAFAAWRAAA